VSDPAQPIPAASKGAIMTTKKSDTANIDGATPGASAVLADEADTAARKPRKAPKGKAAKGKAAKGKARKAAKGKPAKAPKGKAPAARADSKQARFIAAMRTAKGMSITEAAEEFGWQAHTVRGAIAGAIKKKLGLTVTAERDDKRGTVYRIAK
jgi:Protein of unknown function (DUF3489)